METARNCPGHLGWAGGLSNPLAPGGRSVPAKQSGMGAVKCPLRLGLEVTGMSRAFGAASCPLCQDGEGHLPETLLGVNCWGHALLDGQPRALAWLVVASEGFSGHLCPQEGLFGEEKRTHFNTSRF